MSIRRIFKVDIYSGDGELTIEQDVDYPEVTNIRSVFVDDEDNASVITIPKDALDDVIRCLTDIKRGIQEDNRS